MTDAPRTTRLKPVSRCKDEFDFYVSFTGGGTEYIRKDIADARIAELEAALEAVVEEYYDSPAGITLHSIRAHALPALKGKSDE